MRVTCYNDSEALLFQPTNALDEKLLAALYGVIADGGEVAVRPDDGKEPLLIAFTKPGKRVDDENH